MDSLLLPYAIDTHFDLDLETASLFASTKKTAIIVALSFSFRMNLHVSALSAVFESASLYFVGASTLTILVSYQCEQGRQRADHGVALHASLIAYSCWATPRLAHACLGLPAALPA